MARVALLGMSTLMLLVCGAGCGTQDRAAVEANSPGDSIERNASLRQSVDLVGIWFGRAVLDRDGLQTYLNAITDNAERARINEMARAFESVSIAMEFRSDSTMEIEIEILPADSPGIRESTLGTWTVVSYDATSVSVRCTENLDDGQVEEQVLRYEISVDKNMLTTEAPVGKELQAFRPRFEFKRRIESKIAESPGGEQTILR